MPKLKKDEKIAKATITFDVEAIVRNGIGIERLIREFSQFIVEPNSTNGCITKIRLKLVEIK